MTKGFNVMSEKESLVIKKNATILKFKERLDHGNGGGYLLAARLYTSPSDAGKTVKEGKKPERKTTTNLEGATSTTAITTIKRKTRDKEEVEENKTEPH